MRNAVVMLALLLVGGCVSDNGPSPDTDQRTKSSRSKDENADADKPRQVCVDTVEGAEGKHICY